MAMGVGMVSHALRAGLTLLRSADGPQVAALGNQGHRQSPCIYGPTLTRSSPHRGCCHRAMPSRRNFAAPRCRRLRPRSRRSSRPTPGFLTLLTMQCCSKNASGFYLRLLCNTAALKAVRPKVNTSECQGRNYVFSCSRDTSDCIRRLPTFYRDRARQTLFFAPVRVLGGQSLQAQAPTQTRKI